MVEWYGRGVPSNEDDFRDAAQRIGCDISAIMAVWEVEAAGKEFNSDGTLPRRFEPHKLPGSPLNWRDSLSMPEKERWQIFDMAYSKNPEAALRATSWGAPQIMGSNAVDLGYASAADMVSKFADSGSEQVRGFVAFILRNGLATHVRSHDWYKFAVGYNGTGQPETYARKMEDAYRRLSGKKSPVILRFGATGSEVKDLQRLLGVEDDGVFGRETDKAVRDFQRRYGLADDGVVGFLTWKALEAHPITSAGSVFAPVPPSQPATVDTAIAAVSKVSGAATGAVAALAAARELFSEHVWDMLGYALVVAAAAFAVAFVVKKVRR